MSKSFYVYSGLLIIGFSFDMFMGSPLGQRFLHAMSSEMFERYGKIARGTEEYCIGFICCIAPLLFFSMIIPFLWAICDIIYSIVFIMLFIHVFIYYMSEIIYAEERLRYIERNSRGDISGHRDK